MNNYSNNQQGKATKGNDNKTLRRLNAYQKRIVSGNKGAAGNEELTEEDVTIYRRSETGHSSAMEGGRR